MSTLSDAADKTIDAAKAFYANVATRVETAIDNARRFLDEFAENVETALQSRLEGARLGLGGRIRQ